MITKEKPRLFGRHDIITFALFFAVGLLVFSVMFGSIGIVSGMKQGRAWNGDPAPNFAGGGGTAASPYLISNAGQLALMRREVNNNVTGFNTVDTHYKLTADIHLNTTTGWTTWNETSGGANTWEPIGAWKGTEASSHPFRGKFDGDGYTIFGLYVNARNASFQPISVDRQGLFGWAQGAIIRNVGIDQGFVRGGNFTGGIVGFADQTSTLDNVWNGCTVRGTVGSNGTPGAGGGQATSGSPGTAGQSCMIGGVAGHAIVYNSYNKGNVFGGNGGNGGGGGGGGGNSATANLLGTAGVGGNGGTGGWGSGMGGQGHGAGGNGGVGGDSITAGVVAVGSAFNSYNTGNITGGKGGNGGGGGGNGRKNTVGINLQPAGTGGAAGVPWTAGVVGSVSYYTNFSTGAYVNGDVVNAFNTGQITAGTPGNAGANGVQVGGTGGSEVGGAGGAGGGGTAGATRTGGVVGWSENNRIRMAHYQTGRGATVHVGQPSVTIAESSTFNASGTFGAGVLGGYTTLVGAMNRAIEITPAQMPTRPTTVPRWRRFAGTGINVKFADFITIEYNPGPFGVGNTIVENKELTFDYTIRNASVANFTRTHYLQTKWEDESGNIYEFNSTYTLDTPLVLYPVWALNDSNAAALRYELQNRINAANLLVIDTHIYSHATITALSSAINTGLGLLSPPSTNVTNLRNAITGINTAIDNLEARVNVVIMYSPGQYGTGSTITDTPEVGRVTLRGTTFTRQYYTQSKWQDINGVEYELGANLGSTEPLVLYPVWEFNGSDPAALRFVLQGTIDIANQYIDSEMWSSATLSTLQGAIDHGLGLLSPPSTNLEDIQAAINGINTAVGNLAPRVSVLITYNPGTHGVGLQETDNMEVGHVTLRGATYTRLYYNQTKWRTAAGVEYELGATISTTVPLTLFPVWHIDESNPEGVAILLQELLDDAKKLDKDDAYTQATLDILRAAILSAQELIDTESRNLAELLAAVSDITDAVGGLQAKPPSTGDDGDGGGGGGNIIDTTTILIICGFAFASLIAIVFITRLKKGKKA